MVTSSSACSHSTHLVNSVHESEHGLLCVGNLLVLLAESHDWLATVDDLRLALANGSGLCRRAKCVVVQGLC